MEKDYLILKRASASRPSGEWKDDDFDVLADGVVVGRIFKANATLLARRGPRACRDRCDREDRKRPLVIGSGRPPHLRPQGPR
jgi:hypothetical protein